MDIVEQIRKKFELRGDVMDERVTRLWVAAEAMELGPGGTKLVTAATGIRGKRIWKGKQDLEALAECAPTDKPQHQRIRRPGGGRKRIVDTDPAVLKDLESLVDPLTRGDPQSPLRWTTNSTSKLAAEGYYIP